MKILDFLKKNKLWIIFCFLLMLHVFLRFYELEGRTEFRWDQVDNAWVAKDIIVDHKLPLVGMQAKQNSGFFIGPAYYYFIAPFYWVSNLDPIASGVIAGVTSIITFFVVFYVTKKLFSFDVALVAVFLYTISFEIIRVDRFQWPINFITPISLLILYALYNILVGRVRYLFLLAVAVGLSLHINFTSVFFPIVVLLSLPFFPKTKETLKYMLLSLPLFFLFLIPNILSELNSSASSTRNMLGYIDTYYHGIHARRIFQLASDAFLEFAALLWFPFLNFLKYALLPLFGLVFLWRNYTKERLILFYLFCIWILVPWLVFSTYSGEITNYYFSMTRPITILAVSYIFIWVLKRKNFVLKLFVVSFLAYYGYSNITYFLAHKIQGLDYHRKKVLAIIEKGEKVEFQQGLPESYIYYYYTTHKLKK